MLDWQAAHWGKGIRDVEYFLVDSLPAEVLAAQGVDFNSGMPGFGDQLSDGEIWDILAYIKSTWPERERATQAERTAQDIASQGDG